MPDATAWLHLGFPKTGSSLRRAVPGAEIVVLDYDQDVRSEFGLGAAFLKLIGVEAAHLAAFEKPERQNESASSQVIEILREINGTPLPGPVLGHVRRLLLRNQVALSATMDKVKQGKGDLS
ncbi:MAG: hypothetical protein AAFY59_11215 [Pseudomonadota bacterium]